MENRRRVLDGGGRRKLRERHVLLADLVLHRRQGLRREKRQGWLLVHHLVHGNVRDVAIPVRLGDVVESGRELAVVEDHLFAKSESIVV
jgi:hypothetical protein